MLEIIKAALEIQGTMEVTCSGNSMHPTVENGQKVTVEPVGDALGIGDIVYIAVNDVLIIHRIVDIAGEIIITKGDANLLSDVPIDASRVIGRVMLPDSGGETEHCLRLGAVILPGNVSEAETAFFRRLGIRTLHAIPPDTSRYMKVIIAPIQHVITQKHRTLSGKGTAGKGILLDLLNSPSAHQQDGFSCISSYDYVLPVYRPLFYYCTNLLQRFSLAMGQLCMLGEMSCG